MTDYTTTDSIKQHSHGVEIFVSICLEMNSALNAPLLLSAKIVVAKKRLYKSVFRLSELFYILS